MKRHAALVALSREHQHALAVAHRMRTADEASAEEARAAFLALWEQEEQAHFRAEEEILLPAYAKHGDSDHPLLRRALAEHAQIRRDARALNAPDPSLSALHDLGERLHSHVRMEERELFPLVEASLPARELEALALRLRAHS